MGSFNMIIPELPDYITTLGGKEYKGLIIPLFTLTAGLSRPFSGKLADTIGRIPVMIIGTVVCIICGLLYPMLGTLGGFLLLRFAHGFSTGFKPTGTTAYLSDIVPNHKRGEALGILGICGSSGMALGPAIGSYIANEFSMDTMFYCSSVIGLFSMLTVVWMKESIPNPQKFTPKLLKVGFNDFIEPRVIQPSIVMLFTVFSFGMNLTIIPDFCKHLGLENKGIFFTVVVLASLLMRIIAGKASDKYGRTAVLKIGCFIACIGMVAVGLASNPTELLVAGFIVGISVGANAPTIFAWTIDLANPNHRGRAMSTMYIAMELSIGSGAFVAALIYDNDHTMFKYAFWTGGGLALIALMYLFTIKKHEPSS